MDKHDVAKILIDIATLLELKGENPFKIRAYENAARSLENLDDDLEKIVKNNELQNIPGIGEKIAGKVTALIIEGKLPYYEELKESIPGELLSLMRIPSLGGKKIKELREKLGIKTIEDLIQACEKDEVAQLKGFGQKTQNNILYGIKKLESYSQRMVWWNAMKIAQPILDHLKKLKEVVKVEVAGSLRRKLETVGDLEFLVASSKPDPIMDWFTKQSSIEKILAKGKTKSSVRLRGGLQADIRVVPENQFGFALVYFTGSKQHNIKLRHIANEQGYTLNEYTLAPLEENKKDPFPKKNKKKIEEKDIYKFLGLIYIPPELREDTGEIEAAKSKKLPKLIEPKDIRGIFHCHTTDSDGHNTLNEMVQAAEDMGWEYFGISDHSKSSFQANGMDEERLFAQIEKIKKLNRSKKYAVHVFTGIECDILKDGKMDFSDDVLKELDYVIASVHSSFKLSEKEMTKRILKAIENPYTTILGHLTGRLLLKRDAYKVNVNKVIDACIANNILMELNGQPLRLEMDWRHWHRAIEKGLKCCINPDAHSTQTLQYYLGAVNIARKGWLEKDHVFNSLSLRKIKAFFKRRKQSLNS